jgi:hypothetical protein
VRFCQQMLACVEQHLVSRLDARVGFYGERVF